MANGMPRQPEPELMDEAEEAKAYAVADFSQVNQAFADRLLEFVGPYEKAEAVDLGCGPADIPIRVVRARPAWRVTAVDASRAMLELARQNIEAAGLAGAIRCVLSDAKASPLPAGGFDVVFSNSILHHVTATEALWAEVKRIARPRAAIFFRDLARPHSPAAARAIVERHAGGESERLKTQYYNSLLSAYTVEEVRSQLSHAGLKTLEVAMVTDRHLDIFGRLA